MQRKLMQRKLPIGIGVAVIAVAVVVAGFLLTGTTSPPESPVTISFVQTGNPGFPDPAIGSDLPGQWIYHNVYDNLVTYANKVPTELAPHLAESWQVSPDGLKYTFKLRTGVKFHDGSEVTSDAVKFSMDRIMTVNKGFSWMWQGLMQAGNTEVVDKYTVRFTLLKAHAPFPKSIPYLFIVNPKMVKEHIDKSGPYGEWGDYGTKWLNEGNDAGSGPYMLKDYRKAEGYRLERFNDYFKGWKANQISVMVMRYVGEEATIKELMRVGEAQLAGSYQSAPFYTWAKDQPHLTVPVSPQPGAAHYFFFNVKKPPLDDVNLRRALLYLFDANKFVREIRGNIGDRPLAGPLPTFYPGFNDNLKVFEFSPEKAKAELQKSRYWKDIQDGKLRPIIFNFIGGIEWERLAGLQIASEARKLGITLNVVDLPWVRYVELASKAETAPDIVAVTQTGYFLDADAQLYSVFRSSDWHTWNRNPMYYENPEVDRLLDEARKTVDEKTRLEIYKNVQEHIYNDAPAIFAMEQAYPLAYNKNIKGIVYTFSGFWFRPYYWMWSPS